MTAAFNLSQLANSVNTSGQLDIGTAATGTLAVANGGTGRSTITANSLVVGNGTSAVSLLAPGANGTVLSSNGTSWSAVAGLFASSFTGTNQSLSAQGYQKFPGGLIVQWGTCSGGSNKSFPTSFPTACVAVIGNVLQLDRVFNAYSITTTQFTCYTGTTSGGGTNDASCFVAIGY